MIEYENSKSDDQLEELLLLTEQMQEELDQKDRTIEELRVQLDESLTLNERLNSENRAGNIQALKNDLSFRILSSISLAFSICCSMSAIRCSVSAIAGSRCLISVLIPAIADSRL